MARRTRRRNNEAMALSLSLNELVARVGNEIAVSDWIEVSQPVIDEFADAIHDPQWIHVDAERAARESPFRDASGRGCTVAHGFLTLALLTHMLQDAIEITDRRTGINVGFDKVRFTGPVLSGSRIRGRFTLRGTKPVPNGAQLEWAVTVEGDTTGQPVLVADWLTRVLTA
jgi:acyl dehydratase